MMGSAETERSTPTEEQIRSWLVKNLARVLRVSLEEVGVRQSFWDYGLDSVQSVRLAGDLEEWLGVELDPTLAWDYPTIEDLAKYLAAALRSEVDGDE
jgi:acyl carrier protein